jgi:hypothetical protein
MRLPNADNAIIPMEKLRDYLLSSRHPIGRFKAAFFAGLGYTKPDSARLGQDLRSQHLTLEADGDAVRQKILNHRANRRPRRKDGNSRVRLGHS